MIIPLYITGISTILTHGLFMAVIWTLIVIVAVIVLTRFSESKKANFKTAIFIGALVFSHWVLDFVGWPMTVGGINPEATGVPVFLDLNLTIGLGVYSTLVGALAMDLGVFIVGLVIYIRTPRNNE